ncbi:hypothetical protein [Streptomyces bobili]|uniref:hypothetical protein n=1 Tax=Streptomyces bobili TaxID=67280 RepID=UPI0038061070
MGGHLRGQMAEGLAAQVDAEDVTDVAGDRDPLGGVADVRDDQARANRDSKFSSAA